MAKDGWLVEDWLSDHRIVAGWCTFVCYCQCNKSEILYMSTDAFTLGQGTQPTKILDVLVSEDS